MFASTLHFTYNNNREMIENNQRRCLKKFPSQKVYIHCFLLISFNVANQKYAIVDF
jgi:hypothetical protein